MDCKAQAVEDTGSENNLTLKADMVSHSFVQNELDKKANIDHLHNGPDIMAGKIKAEFIDEAICRDSELNDAIAALKNGGNQTSVVLPIPTPNAMSKRVDRLELQMKENMALRAEVKALKKTVQQLAGLLAGVTRQDDEIIFSGVNIHLVNGLSLIHI